MNSAEKEAVLHCLKSMIDEEVCEECPLYGTTGTDHCEKDCVRLAINALSGSEKPNKWIPVETALPEETVSVLVYAERNAYGDNGKYRKKVIDIGWQVDGKWHIDGCNGVVGIAWMSLPTPPNMSEIPTGAEGSEE